MTTATPGTPKSDTLRQRATKANTSPDGTTKTGKASTISSAALDQAQSRISALDILRALAGLALISTIGSYAVTSGQSFTWGVLDPGNRPWFLNPSAVQAAVKGKFASPLELTNEELAAYDGTNEGKPILLALNRTIYDVSASPNVYGPGGMYSTLAAKDASRSYITTCFDPVDDLVPYFGGVEEVYVPLWLSKKPWPEELKNFGGETAGMFGGKDPEDLIEDLQRKVGRKNVRRLQREAYEEARVAVQEKVKSWEGMFGMKNYPVVGRVVGVDEEDVNKWKHLGFCEAARKQRPGMGASLQKALEATGKGDKMNINNMKNMMGGGGKKKKGKNGKKGKKAEGEAEGEEAGDSEAEAPLPVQDHDEKSNVRIEDMMPGGKYYDTQKAKGKTGKEKKRPGIVEEKVRKNLEEGDEEKAKEDIEQLKKDKGGEPQIPDAVPDAVLDDYQKREL